MSASPGYLGAFYVSTGTSSSLTDEAMTADSTKQYWHITAAAHANLDPNVAVTVQMQTDEVQSVTITGSPTGGNFTLTFGANTTGNIAYNAAASAVQTALTGLPSIGANNASVTGPNGGPYIVEFIGSLALAGQSLLTKNAAGLTGGTTPDVSIARVWGGQTWTTVSSGFTLYYPGGVVKFSSPLGLTNSGCRIHAGNYLAVSMAGNAKTVQMQVNNTVIDVTTLQGPSGTPWKTQLPTLNDSNWHMTQWQADNFYLSAIAAGTLLVLIAYSGANSNQRFTAYGYCMTDTINIDVENVNDEALDFQISGPVTFVAS